MKKLLVALLVAALCIAVPAVAIEWDELPTQMCVAIAADYPPGEFCGTYFDVYIDDDGDGIPDRRPVYPGWCVDTMTEAIKNTPYCADLSTTIGVSSEWNKINWIINHKGDASYGEVQAAIWMTLGQQVPARFASWKTDAAYALVSQADPSFTPRCDMIGAILVVPSELKGQAAIIEVPTPPCPPPVPEFPTMMIPVFLVGSVLVAASVLKKE